MTGHRFGGPWTEDKLERIDKYLDAYMTLFKGNPKARKLRTTYLDAFAGTGFRESSVGRDRVEGSLFEDALEDAEAKALKEGSAYVALNTDPAFDRYVFVDRNAEHARNLEYLKQEFPRLADKISVEVADANDFLRRWCRLTNWRENRAVVFLDPYGMQVDWSTIEAVAATEAIDLWILFPLGLAVNRLLTTRKIPEGAHAERLTRFLGTDQWKEAFYEEVMPDQPSMFEQDEVNVVKRANFEAIGNFFVRRLETVFAGVAKTPLALRNSKEVPLFLLCFAASNPRGARTAVKIASQVLRP